MSTFIRASILGIGLAMASGAWALPAVAQKKLTIATLAPKKSAWDKVFSGMAKEIEEKTGGSVILHVYAGGSQGDEELAVQKVRTGQIHGAAITSIGLGKISSNALVLQVPMLFENWGEVDHVRDQMKGRFETEFRDQGFELLGWGDVGFVHVFSNEPVRDPADMKKVKMWAWTSDPISQQMIREAGGSPIPLGVPDVLPSLDTGLINAFYNGPYAAIALRWFTKAKFFNTKPIGVGLGATVVSTAAWNTLSAQEQAVVKEVSAKWHEILRKKVRKDDAASIPLLQKEGLTAVELTPEQEAQWRAVGKRTEAALVGKVYSQEILDEVRKHLSSRRGGK